MKKRIVRKALIVIGAIALTLVMAYSYTNGFANTLHEAFGLSGNSKVKNSLFGMLDIKKGLISLVVIVAFYVVIFLKRKKSE